MNRFARDIFHELWVLAKATERPLRYRYRELRGIFERIAREQMQNVALQATDLAARINYIAYKFSLDNKCTNALHTFRLTSNDIMNHRKEPLDKEFLRDVRTVAEFCQVIFNVSIPEYLDKILPEKISKKTIEKKNCTSFRRIRVCFDYADDEFMYVRPVDEISEQCWKIRYNQLGVNNEFAEGISDFWRHAQLNLLDVRLNADGTYTPSFIVLEPDYLLDISALAECYRDYGSHPANYLMGRLVPVGNSRSLLLGNIANLFLDEWINAHEEVPDYMICMKKAFRLYSMELATCEELFDPEKEALFFKDCRMHFYHIRQIVKETFQSAGYSLDKSDAVLEPTYICEALGIQGRLDYMQRNMSSFIEMKSGKADEYVIKGKIEPKENNRVQMLLYMAVLEYSMGIDHRKLHSYLLYTRYPLLYPARTSWAQVRRIISLRNRIVATEYETQMHNHPSYTAKLLAQINPVTLNEKKIQGRFWEQYLAPEIINFQQRLQALSNLEQTYVYTIYNFITKELYTSKSGDVEHENKIGASTLWLSMLEEKKEAGGILYDLRIIANRAYQLHKATITLQIPEYRESFLPNFRKGDVVVLYERNHLTDNVTNKLVFKGNIERLTDKEVCIRLRASQRNLKVFPVDSLYAIEHDYMDVAFRNMYLGLSAFMDANQARKDLLLGKRLPQFDEGLLLKCPYFIDDFERVATKALAAKDYFLLVGPPGTGKTSCALRRMVEKFYAQPYMQILLLAYTNRAVDEICASLDTIKPVVNYIRIGSELSCDERYREHLMENILTSCNNRKDVRACLSSCRVYVGTVASISSKMELFKLKHFDVAIIDEATQILESHLLWILSAKSSDGQDAVGKFVLIGDHKQLPAVVLQSPKESEVFDGKLRQIGLYNLKDSLFERLYRFHSMKENSFMLDMLCRQGRMHPDVAFFPNQTFYSGKLCPVGLPHQQELISSPVLFIPSQRDTNSLSGKTNLYEARIIADLVERIWNESPETFNPHRTLGVITPYRNQIALIRKELQAKGVPALTEISVDTVERYQGSERDVILYSFCVNHRYQLKYLPNLTEENGVQIDRKFNVVLTRARKRLIVTGVKELLCENQIYARFISLYSV